MASKKGSGGGTLDDGALDGPTLPSGSAKPQLPAARPAAPKRDSMRSPVGAPRPVAPSVSSNSRPATPAGPPAPAPRGTSKPQTRSFAVARPAPVPLPGEDDDVPSGATDELPGVGATDRNGTAVASIGGDQDEKLGTAILDLAPALQKAEGTAIVDLESAVAARGLRSAPAPTASRGPYILGAVAMVLIGGVLLAA